jgi:hypothetical protein
MHAIHTTSPIRAFPPTGDLPRLPAYKHSLRHATLPAERVLFLIWCGFLLSDAAVSRDLVFFSASTSVELTRGVGWVFQTGRRAHSLIARFRALVILLRPVWSESYCLLHLRVGYTSCPLNRGCSWTMAPCFTILQNGNDVMSSIDRERLAHIRLEVPLSSISL